MSLQLIMPGYCVSGTVGHKVLSGNKKIEIEKKTVTVRLSVQYMSFRCEPHSLIVYPLIYIYLSLSQQCSC